MGVGTYTEMGAYSDKTTIASIVAESATIILPYVVPNVLQEWLRSLSCVQLEEKERIAKFVHARDAKLALVGK